MRGPNSWQQHHHKAIDALRSAMKGDRKYTSIWDRWQNDEVYPTSQLAHIWTNAWVRYLDFIVPFDITTNRHGKENDMSIWFICEVLTRTRKRDHGSDLGRKKEAKRALACLQKTERTRSSLHASGYWNSSEQRMVKFSLGGALCGTAKSRTPTTTIIFKLVAKLNMVVFVILGSKLANTALIWMATKSGQTEGKKDKVGFTP